MTERFIQASRWGLLVLLLGGGLNSCSQKEGATHWNVQSNHVLTNVFGVHLGAGWRLIHATGTTWDAPLDAGSHNTRYLLLHAGTLAASRELLKNLENINMSTLNQKPIADGQALRVADWWHPELLGECTAAQTNVKNANRSYLLSLKLFQTETNTLLFTSIMVVVR